MGNLMISPVSVNPIWSLEVLFIHSFNTSILFKWSQLRKLGRLARSYWDIQDIQLTVAFF